jgi:hypothetical protein
MARPTLPLAVWKDSSVAPQANSVLSKRNWRSSLSSVLRIMPLLQSIQVLPSLFTVVFSFFLSIISSPSGDELDRPFGAALRILPQNKKTRPNATWSVHMMRYPKPDKNNK